MKSFLSSPSVQRVQHESITGTRHLVWWPNIQHDCHGIDGQCTIYTNYTGISMAQCIWGSNACKFAAYGQGSSEKWMRQWRQKAQDAAMNGVFKPTQLSVNREKIRCKLLAEVSQWVCLKIRNSQSPVVYHHLSFNTWLMFGVSNPHFQTHQTQLTHSIESIHY